MAVAVAVADTMAVAVTFVDFSAIIRSHQEIQWSGDFGLGGTFPHDCITSFQLNYCPLSFCHSSIPPLTCPNSPVPAPGRPVLLLADPCHPYLPTTPGGTWGGQEGGRRQAGGRQEAVRREAGGRRR